MKIPRSSDRETTEIDVSSFSDIAFLLIIFFIVTTAFLRVFGDKLNVPNAEPSKSKKEQKQLTITVDPDNIFYGEKANQVTLAQMRELLKDERFPKRKEKERLVTLNCSKDVPYQRYFEVVTAISKAGGVLVLIEEDDSEAKKKL